MGELSVTIEGNELVVDTYQKTLITVRDVYKRQACLCLGWVRWALPAR